MPGRILARKVLIAALLVFAATMAVLLSRQFSLAPARPSPDFRAFGPKDAPPLDLLQEWREESYRAVAPKKLSALLP